MKLGISLCPEVGRWHDTVAQTKHAVELGFDSLWLPEHHLMAGYQPAPMLGLAGIVDSSADLLLGTDIVVAPFHHPVRIAEDAAVLQDMSGGRFILGLGLGYRPEEFAAFNVPFAKRATIFTEQLELIRLLLTEERVDYSGTHFRVEDVTIYPRPTPTPPIWVGGWVRPAIQRAAELADAWFPGPTASVDKVERCLAMYDTELLKLGRSREDLPIFREIWVADDDSLMEAGVGPLQAMYADDYVRWSHQNLSGETDVAQDRFIVGSSESVAEQILELTRKLGVTHLVARLHFHRISQDAVIRSMKLLAEQVRPAVETGLANA